MFTGMIQMLSTEKWIASRPSFTTYVVMTEKADQMREDYLKYRFDGPSVLTLGALNLEFDPSGLCLLNQQIIASWNSSVDSGASIDMIPHQLVPLLPKTCVKLRRPIIMQQGKGRMQFWYVGIVARCIELENGTVAVMVTPAIPADLDNNTDLVSARVLSKLGLGMEITPCNPFGTFNGVKPHPDRLVNFNRSVSIPMYSKPNGIPYFVNSFADLDSSSNLVDAFFGTPLDLPLAVRRARKVFEHLFFGPTAGTLFEPPAGFNFELQTVILDPLNPTEQLYSSPSALTLPSSGGENRTLNSQGNEIHSLYRQSYQRFLYQHNESAPLQGAGPQENHGATGSVLDTPFQPDDSDFNQASLSRASNAPREM